MLKMEVTENRIKTDNDFKFDKIWQTVTCKGLGLPKETCGFLPGTKSKKHKLDNKSINFLKTEINGIWGDPYTKFMEIQYMYPLSNNPNLRIFNSNEILKFNYQKTANMNKLKSKKIIDFDEKYRMAEKYGDEYMRKPGFNFLNELPYKYKGIDYNFANDDYKAKYNIYN